MVNRKEEQRGDSTVRRRVAQTAHMHINNSIYSCLSASTRLDATRCACCDADFAHAPIEILRALVRSRICCCWQRVSHRVFRNRAMSVHRVRVVRVASQVAAPLLPRCSQLESQACRLARWSAERSSSGAGDGCGRAIG